MKKIDPTIYEIGHILSRQDISGEYWMTNLSPLLRQLPIMYLCIPGTIHSYSYSSSLPLYKKHQNSNITNQLMNGIRYLTIKVYWDDLKKKWMCDEHVSFQDVLRQVNMFAMTHLNEIILLHIQSSNDSDSVNYISLAINHLSHQLFERKRSEINKLWFSLYSLNHICNSGKNIILINSQFTHHHCIFPPSMKYIQGCKTEDLNYYLPLSPISICSSFKLPSFLLKIDWNVCIPYRGCCMCLKPMTDDEYSTYINESHEALIEYIHSPYTSVENLNKIFILSVEFENSIDLLYLCMQIMDKRFYT
jgi:hypothetical protein